MAEAVKPDRSNEMSNTHRGKQKQIFTRRKVDGTGTSGYDSVVYRLAGWPRRRRRRRGRGAAASPPSLYLLQVKLWGFFRSYTVCCLPSYHTYKNWKKIIKIKAHLLCTGPEPIFRDTPRTNGVCVGPSISASIISIYIYTR